jgi:hypothetical protein
MAKIKSFAERIADALIEDFWTVKRRRVPGS